MPHSCSERNDFNNTKACVVICWDNHLFNTKSTLDHFLSLVALAAFDSLVFFSRAL